MQSVSQPGGHPKKWTVLAIAALSVFMATLDSSIVNIALPDISKEMHVSISSVQWVVTSYLLAISLLLLFWGKLSDLYGKKLIFSSGFLVFAFGSLMCALSHALPFLVLARVVQAVGASAMMSLSQGIVTAVFPPQERGRSLGLIGMMVALGSLTGPSLGGVLVQLFRWQSIFIINIPIGVVGGLLSFLFIPEIFETQEDKRFDLKGFALFSLSLLFLFLGLLFVQEGALPLWALAPSVALFAASFAAFLLLEKRCAVPLINLRLFRVHEFSGGLATAYLSFITINAVLLFMPFYLQTYRGFSALTAGLIIMAYPLMTGLCSPLSGWLSDRIGYRPLTVAGMAVSTTALLLLSTLGARTPVWEVVALLMLMSLGVATFQSPNNSSVMGSVSRRDLGIAGGVNALARNLGMVSGTTFSVLIFSLVTRVSIDAASNGGAEKGVFLHGFTAVMLFSAAAAFSAFLLSVGRAALPLRRPRGGNGSAPAEQLTAPDEN